MVSRVKKLESDLRKYKKTCATQKQVITSLSRKIKELSALMEKVA